MPKSDDDLFTRLRRAGVRKPVAKRLSELSDDAGKKAIGAGYRAVAELRALADEIEKRLPAPSSLSTTEHQPTPLPSASSRPVTLPAASKRVTPRRAPAKRAPAKRPPAARPRKSAAASAAAPAASAPRGENKAKILGALSTGPHTASEIGQATGIATATVSAALTRLTKSGEVIKATRGYGLPS
jgi:predicted Rossmann fold nucleotide-binding protein DprA/Smf involved in DNA uptake